MMQSDFKLKWFKEGDTIPAGSRFVRTENRVVGVRSFRREELHGWSTGEEDLLETQYLYEVPLPPKAEWQDMRGVGV